MHFSFRQKQRVINGQRFGRHFPLHPPIYPFWTIFVERISSVKWTFVQPVALHLGVIVFDPFQIYYIKRIFELFILEFPFCVSNEISDDRRQKKCCLISTLVIALLRTSGITVILIRKFRPQRKPHLLRR